MRLSEFSAAVGPVTTKGLQDYWSQSSQTRNVAAGQVRQCARCVWWVLCDLRVLCFCEFIFSACSVTLFSSMWPVCSVCLLSAVWSAYLVYFSEFYVLHVFGECCVIWMSCVFGEFCVICVSTVFWVFGGLCIICTPTVFMYLVWPACPLWSLFTDLCVHIFPMFSEFSGVWRGLCVHHVLCD